MVREEITHHVLGKPDVFRLTGLERDLKWGSSRAGYVQRSFLPSDRSPMGVPIFRISNGDHTEDGQPKSYVDEGIADALVYELPATSRGLPDPLVVNDIADHSGRRAVLIVSLFRNGERYSTDYEADVLISHDYSAGSSCVLKYDA
jgi:hypothetical protein